MAGKDNLKPITHLSPEEAKQRGSKGGKASVKARREKKRMSEIYAEFLIKEHDVVDATGEKKKMTGHALCNRVMNKVMSRGDSSSVSMLREIREGTEGSKMNLDIPPLEIRVIIED